MSDKKIGVITGNGAVDNDGRGVVHSFPSLTPIQILKEIRDDQGNLTRLLCQNDKGKEQLVMPHHVKQ